MSRPPLRVLTIGHSYVVAQNQAVPAAIARDPRVELTLAAPRFHYGDLRRIALERTAHPDYHIAALPAYFTRKNHIMWYHPSALRRLLQAGRFDLVHAWEEPYTLPGYQLGRAAGRAGSRFVFRTAQSLVKSYPWPFRYFERATLARADGWVAGGRLVFDAMTSKGFPAARGRVINLGVNTTHFRPHSQPEIAEVRREIGLAAPIIGFLGRLVRAKGLDVLMAALERVTQPWSLFLLGSGPYETVVGEWAARHGWSERVRIKLVTHDDVPRYLSAIDLLAAPSQTTPQWKEQFGRMVIEAFACGVPVIGSDSGEIPFVVEDAGVIVPEADVASWARAFEELLSDGARRSELGRRGLARCRERYDVTAIARQYVDFYVELMDRAPAGARAGTA